VRASVALLAAATLLTSACGAETGGDDGEPLEAAIEAWVAADTGSFEHVTNYLASEDGPKQVIKGEYELSTNEAAFSQKVTGLGDEDVLLEYVIADERVFMHSAGWPVPIRACWLVVDDAALAETGLPPSAADSLPANLQALRTLEVVNGKATVELLSAVPIFLGARFLSTLDLEKVEGRIPVEVELDDGRIRSWRVEGRHVGEALQAAGAGLDANAVYALRPMTSEAVYSDLGEPVDVTAPPERVRMTGAEMEARTCRAS
jgi:hypothetical protein